LSINNEEKLQSISLERPKSKGRPVKHYHPLLQRAKEIECAVRKILPKEIADFISPKGSRLAHLYGLPKTHKKELAMRPILSAIGRGLCGQIVSFRDPPLRNRKFLHNKNPYHYLSVQKKFPRKIPAHSREMFI
jgi:hypothetical protein